MNYNMQKTKKTGKATSAKGRIENKGFNRTYNTKGNTNLNIMLKDYKNFCDKYFGNSRKSSTFALAKQNWCVSSAG